MKARHLVYIRRFCQAVCLCLFLYLLVGARLPQDVFMDYSQSFDGSRDIGINGPVTFFFQMDPLVWLSSVISTRQWIVGFGWAILLLMATVLFGRFFCSFICPFGTVHNMAGAIRPSLKGKAMVAANRSGNSRRIKYFLFILFMAAACAGMNFAGLMDPISFLFRSLSVAILPALGIGLNGILQALAVSDIKVFNYLGYGLEALTTPVFGYDDKAFQTGWVIGILFLGILFLNRIRPRFWCRILCPLGALLGICSRFSLLVLEKDDTRCTHCGLCTRTCQGAAAPEPGQIWRNSECLLCFNCTQNCPEDALAFHFKWPGPKGAKTDIGRRAVMSGLLAGVALPLFGRLDGKLSKTAAPDLIRPPGSLPEAEFLDRCQRCGLCMKVCPTNVINPALVEAGLAGFWTPVLKMTLGYCEYTCTLCTGVCPTGAIRPLTVKDKIQPPVRIGSAYIDRGRCLPWNGNSACIVCEEHCPTSPKAIYFKNDVVTGSDGRDIAVQLPFVDLNRCIGCGICQFKCPVKGRPAILTLSAGESRSLENRILL